MQSNNILIVDDDNSVLKLLGTLLEDNGYNTIKALNCEQVIDILKKEQIFVILMDLQMPGIKGTALCKLIKESDNLPWIAAISGDFELFNSNEFKNSGFDDFFAKPIDLPILLNALEYAFARLERLTTKLP